MERDRIYKGYDTLEKKYKEMPEFNVYGYEPYKVLSDI